jgi:hypothetical protein
MREQQLDQRHVPVESGFMERPMAAAHKVRIRFRGAPLPWRTASVVHRTRLRGLKSG